MPQPLSAPTIRHHRERNCSKLKPIVAPRAPARNGAEVMEPGDLIPVGRHSERSLLSEDPPGLRGAGCPGAPTGSPAPTARHTCTVPTLTPNTTPTAATLPLSAICAPPATSPLSSASSPSNAIAPDARAEPCVAGQNASEYVLNKSQAAFNRGLTALPVESSVLPALSAR